MTKSRLAILAASVACALGAGFLEWGYWPGDGPPVSIRARTPTQRVLLASEARERLQAGDSKETFEFELTNTSAQPQELEILSLSCGCLNAVAGEASVGKGARFGIAPRGATDFSVSAPLQTLPGVHRNSVLLQTSSEGAIDVVFQTEIISDLVVEGGTLAIGQESAENSRLASLPVVLTVRERPHATDGLRVDCKGLPEGIESVFDRTATERRDEMLAVRGDLILNGSAPDGFEKSYPMLCLYDGDALVAYRRFCLTASGSPASTGSSSLETGARSR